MSATAAPARVEWDGRSIPISEVWDYGADNPRIATTLEVCGWEPKWFFVGRGKIKRIFLRCRMTGAFFPMTHYTVAPGWVEGMR